MRTADYSIHPFNEKVSFRGVSLLLSLIVGFVHKMIEVYTVVSWSVVTVCERV